MQIIQRLRGDVVVLELRGPLHCGNGDRDLEQVIRACTAQGFVKMIMNLKDVSHIDTMCLGVFIAAQVRFQRRGGGVNLLQTPARIRHILAIAKLDRFLPTFDTEDDAMRAFPSSLPVTGS